jgi:tetratricopeptide (TPR) repeat protein
MAVTSTLAVTAFQARNAAREERRQAEGLVAFMLGDLKDKLEPIGRLDALDGVGSRVLAYYSRQDKSELTDASLTQRSKALSLMGQIADARGDSRTSLKLYREAMAGTAEAMRRRPTDPEPIFDHAQNVFYVGSISHDDGDFRTAENSFREYQRLARQMIALQPDSMKYRMEQQYAEFNLGVVLSDERRFAEAVSQFEEALSTMQAISSADPSNKSYQQNIAESLTWLADAERAVGKYDRAIAHRQRNVAVYNQLLRATGDVQYRQHIVPALRSLGDLYEERGQHAAAETQYRASVANADALVTVEPNNTVWTDYGIRGYLDLARVLIATGRHDEARLQASTASRMLDALLRRPSPKLDWRKDAINRDLTLAKLALVSGSRDEAFELAQRAVNGAHAIHTVDKIADSFRVARALLLQGDVQRERGDLASARAAWTVALAAVPNRVTELPDEMAVHAGILDRLGRGAEAQPLKSKLNSIGYRTDL